MDKILFFDGVCVMCNSLVGFLLRHDKKRIFKFATLQGNTAQKLIPESTRSSLTSVVLIDEKGTHTESNAIIRLFMGLNGIYRLACILLIVPKFIRDGVYRFIARNRYRWFGKTDNCALLSKEDRERILD